MLLCVIGFSSPNFDNGKHNINNRKHEKKGYNAVANVQ